MRIKHRVPTSATGTLAPFFQGLPLPITNDTAPLKRAPGRFQPLPFVTTSESSGCHVGICGFFIHALSLVGLAEPKVRSAGARIKFQGLLRLFNRSVVLMGEIEDVALEHVCVFRNWVELVRLSHFSKPLVLAIHRYKKDCVYRM